MATYFMGIDVGTGSVRVGLFDRDGRTMGIGVGTYPLSIVKNGWGEQEPEDWWRAIKDASRRVLADTHIRPEDIAGISLDATCCTCVFADSAYRPLRPAIMWMDLRAANEAEEISQLSDPALKYCGYGNVSAEWLPCKVLWVKRHEPELYARTARIVESVDWLTYRMTGVETLSLNNVSVRWFYDNRRGGWPVAFYEKMGLGDVFSRFPDTVLPMGAYVGGLTAAAAADLGLVAGIPVAEGGADAHTGVIGLNVTAPGRMALITGSSHLHLSLSNREINGSGIMGAFPDAIVPGLYLLEGSQISTGSVVNWVKNVVSEYADKEEFSSSQDVYRILNDKAAKLSPGSDGLLMTDYFQGNRSPYADANLRGMVYGLSLGHRPEHIYRAALEGICYGTEHILRIYRELGFDTREIYVSGGATKSRLWLQIHADVSNVPLHVPQEPEAPCLGSAVLGAVGCGMYPDIPTAAEKMVHFVDRIEPDAAVHESYQFFADRYMEVYPLMADFMHRMSKHETDGK